MAPLPLLYLLKHLSTPEAVIHSRAAASADRPTFVTQQPDRPTVQPPSRPVLHCTAAGAGNKTPQEKFSINYPVVQLTELITTLVNIKLGTIQIVHTTIYCMIKSKDPVTAVA